MAGNLRISFFLRKKVGVWRVEDTHAKVKIVGRCAFRALLCTFDDNQSKDNKEENSNSTGKKEEKIDKLKRAAVTTLSAAAVKAKILANQEEDQIRQLAMILIEKQIIAARLGLPASSSRGVAPTLPANRMAMNFPNSAPRPPMGMTPQRPPISGPPGMAPTNPNPQYATTSTTISGSSIRPANQDTLSSVGTK
uniref:SMARCC C-terminal domain-containing protein n=1 Tax=Cucumis sativus TaxID=3659 RepID=A0A0A0K3R8_CUCSA